MDAKHFDALTRTLTTAGTRRGLLGLLPIPASLPILGGLIALLDIDRTDAKRRHKKKRKKKKCKKPTQVCAGRCGRVTYKCKKRKKTVDCGRCPCDPPCGGATPICDDGACVACSTQHPCSEGCCAANGSCQSGDSTAFCGPDGGVCVQCTGVDEVCLAGACVVPACGEPGGPCLVFVTSESFHGNLEGTGGLAAADGICQRLADDADRPGAYMAWLSTELVSPANRFTRAQGPYRRVDGVKVADNYSDLTTEKSGGTYLAAPINVTESGGVVANHAAWTFTLANGNPGSSVPGILDCVTWTNGTGDVFGAFGNVNNSTVNAGWTDGGALRCDNFNASPFRLYCFQQS